MDRLTKRFAKMQAKMQEESDKARQESDAKFAKIKEESEKAREESDTKFAVIAKVIRMRFFDAYLSKKKSFKTSSSEKTEEWDDAAYDGVANPEVFKEGNDVAHTGEVILDVILYTDGIRKDTRTFRQIYGVTVHDFEQHYC